MLFRSARLEKIGQKIQELKLAISGKDFDTVGRIAEAEALEFHAITMTSTPSLIYWIPSSLRLVKLVQKWRAAGLPVYFNLNTGQDVHILCQSKDVPEVEQRLKELDFVKRVIVNKPSVGTRLTDEHLF